MLEKMFPGWTAGQLFERVTDDQPTPQPPDDDGPAAPTKAAQLLQAIDQQLTAPRGDVEWGTTRQPTTFVSPTHLDAVEGATDEARRLGRQLLKLQQVLRLTNEETAQFATLAGNIVELTMTCDIDIDPDGWSRVTYRHQLMNLSNKPMTRLAREVWFETTRERLVIDPINDPEHRVMIQRRHDTANLSKFACQISPPLQPGQTATIGFICEGGRVRPRPLLAPVDPSIHPPLHPSHPPPGRRATRALRGHRGRPQRRGDLGR
ncbi:hypothetical protein [Actinomadura miaoliensis]|uniref:Uncharacterized protein n=1 Tax=Actinomadura miaoliensis TaxID=430685 RepID=A0ABP7VCG8_9ACTN